MMVKRERSRQPARVLLMCEQAKEKFASGLRSTVRPYGGQTSEQNARKRFLWRDGSEITFSASNRIFE